MDSDNVFAIALDASGNAYVAGFSFFVVGNFPVTPGAFQTIPSSEVAFVAKVGPADAPGLTLFPTKLDFGNQSTPTASGPRVLVVNNSGSATLGITSIAISGTDAGDFSQSNNTCGATVAGGSRCAVDVTFAPTTTGPKSATLSIVDNAAGSPHSLSLTGTGVPPAPLVSLSPGFLDFGSLPVGTTSSAQTVVLTNTGDVTLNISGITVSGDFGIASNSCGTSLAPAGNCNIGVTFKPTAPGTRNGTLSIADDAAGSPHTVALSGTGGQPAVGFSPGSLSFGNRNVGTTSTAQSVTLTNSGDGTLNITSIFITGPNAGDFAQTNTCGTSVAAGANCAISVTFAPTATGARIGTVTITDDASGSPHTVTLTGTGSQDFSLASDPTSKTVTAGQSATFTLSVTPAGGFNQSVSLACTGAPSLSTCTVSPASVTPDGTNPATAPLSVATTARSAAPPVAGRRIPPHDSPPLFPWVLALLALTTVTSLVAAHRRRPQIAFGLTIFWLLLWASCGGGGKPAPNPSTPAGTFDLTVTGISGGLSHALIVKLTVN